MLRIDKAILDTSGVICDNIARFGATERGLLSQNILGHIRNFVEYVAIKAFSNGADVNPNDYNLNVAALKDMQRHGNLRFLYRFHELLQKSVSHYTVDKDGSERLMLKYYEHLFKTKLYLKQAYNLDVLENIEDFPLDTDTELSDYYTKIAERIETPSRFSYAVTYNDRYYVQKIKPFFINQRIYYEVTFTAATANTSKFDRVIAFTSHEIMDNYAIKFSIYESIFEHSNNDEIILCLNYDGLYGINNINRFLQNSNPNEGIVWGINTYKIGDPVLFNESNIFSPLIHNNTKGRIAGIHPDEQQIWFDIELEESINEIDAWDYDFELIGESESGNSIISFSVNKFRSTDEDDDNNNSTVVPFQVAYAVSIHKAQGLEYDSVKIVITNEVEERITHNIFYTAITRAKNKLKIYWSPETEKSVLEHLEVKNSNKDAHLLAQLFSIAMTN